MNEISGAARRRRILGARELDEELGRALDGDGYFEPQLTTMFLPGCRACGTAHPWAQNPPVNSDECVKCGALVEKPGEAKTVKAVLTGTTPSTMVAKICLGLGKALSKLAKGL